MKPSNPRDSRETQRPTLAVNGTGRATPQMHPRQILARRQRNAAAGIASRTPEQQAAHREVCSSAGLPY
mgnify:CR=1 FL=1